MGGADVGRRVPGPAADGLQGGRELLIRLGLFVSEEGEAGFDDGRLRAGSTNHSPGEGFVIVASEQEGTVRVDRDRPQQVGTIGAAELEPIASRASMMK